MIMIVELRYTKASQDIFKLFWVTCCNVERRETALALMALDVQNIQQTSTTR